MKIVINIDYGNFCLSQLALDEFNKLKKTNKYTNKNIGKVARNDADLVTVIEQLGKKASGSILGCSLDIRIITIPNGVEWEICDYDGIEYVREIARNWVHEDDEYWARHLENCIVVGDSDA